MKPISLATVMIVPVLAAIGAACGDSDANPTPSPSPRPTATVVPATGDLPIPDPHELYVATEDGVSLVMQSSRNISHWWSPSGELIVTESSYGYTPAATRISVVQPDGAARVITEFDGYDSGDPLWSPDGDRLLLASADEPASRIISVQLTDGEITELLSGEPFNPPSLLAWLDTGEVLLARGVGGRGELLFMDPSTGGTRPVTDSAVSAQTYLGRAALSRDQTRLLIGGYHKSGACREAGSGDSLFVIELATGEATTVAKADSCSVASVAWSPDETAVAYSLFYDAGGLEGSGAFVVDLASGQSHRVSSDLDANLRWLDDDTLVADRLVCWGCDGGIEGLMLLRADGSGEEKLFEGGGHEVSRSGDRIAVADEKGVRTVGLDGELIDSVSEAEPGWGYGRFSWAPDDKSLAFTRSHQPLTKRVFEVDANGQNFETVAVATDQYQASSLLSPDGRRRAIVRSDNPSVEKSAQLWLANGDGSNEMKVDVYPVSQVAWSPDGWKLAVIGEWKAPDGLSTVGLYIVNADGAGLINLEVGLNQWGPVPVWSPDSNNIAIPEYERELVLINLPQSRTTEVDVAAIGDVGAISWSADSQTVAVLARPDFPPGPNSIVLVNADGTVLRSVPGITRPHTAAGLSPGGDQVAYWGTVDNQYVLFLVDTSTGEEVRIITSEFINMPKIVWSPDGIRFATALDLPEGSGIYVIDVDDLEMRQVTDGGNVTDLWWVSPDRLGFRTEVGGL